MSVFALEALLWSLKAVGCVLEIQKYQVFSYMYQEIRKDASPSRGLFINSYSEHAARSDHMQPTDWIGTLNVEATSKSLASRYCEQIWHIWPQIY